MNGLKRSALAGMVAAALVSVTGISVANAQCGKASWYGPGFHGRSTASGERFNQSNLTAAHKYLPFGTKLRVTNARNGKSVVVRINDRGPYVRGRLLDLSKGAATQIGMVRSGSASVCIAKV
ncbi:MULTISPECIES: septal ring lytic transglycosylase RlpA family protein [Mesorhizobium]|uniref:Endolytic peptidoglycan transglycosylase RlpA n=1 Tax=Mesorhizobium denitrificans TaxID=2294114 RepID=A0A371XJV6_9HYPH|nr:MULTISPECIES: septal ring lytic transglycosylase RlpA family protein [Mesorhizobium]RFC69517.1 septal ring lytic transglycosylase RlpA family protein [Mesorhizobium denitrificans]